MTNSISLDIGANAPEFSLPIDGSGTMALADLKGRNVVLYFYPKDHTPGCTMESKDFAILMPEFIKHETAIIGISKDSVKSHDKFKSDLCLPFNLASDVDGKICEAYGVWIEKSMYGKKYMGIERTTFLIDKSGIIRHVWRKVSVNGHAQEVLDKVKTLS
jgi:peroxiredoxin Q/BCP